MKHLRLLLLFTLLAASSAFAQSVLSWSGTGGPCGFFVSQLIDLPEGLLAVSGQKIYYSGDGGVSWEHRGTIDMPRFLTYGYAISPSGEIFLGGHGNPTGAVLFRSADQGRTWQPLSLPGRSGAAIALTADGDILAGGPNGSIHRSSDNGTTWEATPLSTVLGGAIVVLPDNSILAGGIVDSKRGLYRSTDNGRSWVDLFPEIPYREVSRIITTGGQGVVIAVAYIGQVIVAQSKDGGNTWTEEQLPWAVHSAESMISMEGILHVGTSTGQVLRRNVATGAWEQYGTMLPDRYIAALAFDSEHQQLVAGLVPGPFRLVRNDAGEQAWAASCGDIFDIASTHIVFSPAGNVLVATLGGGIYRSSHPENDWQVESGTDYSVTAMAEFTDGALVFGSTLGGLYHVAPGVDTARRIDRNFSHNTVPAVAIANGNEILAGTLNGVLYSSTDNGVTWDSIVHTGGIREIVPYGNDIYLATATGLFRRRAGDATLTRVNVASGSPNMTTLSIAPGGYMAVAGNERAWFSNNAGASWTLLPALARNYNIGSIAVGSDGKVYVVLKHSSVRNGRVYHILPPSQQWKDADRDGDSLAAYALAIAPDGTVYATSTTQVFRADRPSAVPSSGQNAAIRTTLDITPMPASTSAAIRFLLPSAGETTLVLSDMNGREVVRQALGNREKGENAVEIDLALLAPGLYSCEIRRGETRIPSILRVVR